MNHQVTVIQLGYNCRYSNEVRHIVNLYQMTTLCEDYGQNMKNIYELSYVIEIRH